MSVCIDLRNDYDGVQLRDLAKRSRDPRQVRRLLALVALLRQLQLSGRIVEQETSRRCQGRMASR